MVELHVVVVVVVVVVSNIFFFFFFFFFFFIYILRSGAARSYGQSLVFFKRHFVVTIIMAPTEYTSLVP